MNVQVDALDLCLVEISRSPSSTSAKARAPLYMCLRDPGVQRDAAVKA